MSDTAVFVVLGLGTGAIYALLALGVLAIYRGSGLINFAQGAFALVGAGAVIELRPVLGAPLAIAAGIAAGALLGIVTQNLVMRPLRHAAPLIRVVATLGLLITLQAIAFFRYGSTPITSPSILPHASLVLFGATIQSDRLSLLVIAIAVAVGLSLAQRRTLIGLATLAAAENEVSIASLGWSPNLLATANWALGGALAGLAGAMIVPLTGLATTNLTLLIVPALAAALLGGFDSVGLTLAGAVGIGIAQSLLVRYTTQTGVIDAIPFLVIIAVLVITGRSLPLRSHVHDRLPWLGDGVVRPLPIVIAMAASVVLMLFVFPLLWQSAFTVSLAFAVILLSVVVLTGYAGQLSLAQYGMAGLGAFVAGRLMAGAGWSFLPAALVAIVAAVPIGAVFAVPALRTRGVNLAVVTLGMGVAVNSVLFSNVDWTGGFEGTTISHLTLLGLDVTNLKYPGRYGVLVIAAFAICALAVANLRRSAAGRRMIAIRENERAAASLGISVVGAKLYAFAVASAIAALGGILFAFYNIAILYSDFDAFHSIYALAYAVIGGLGYVVGPVFGAALTEGGINSLFNPLFGSLEKFLPLIAGVIVIVTLLLNQDGIVGGLRQQSRLIIARLPKRPPRVRHAPPETITTRTSSGEEFAQPVPPRVLEVRNLTVRFGGVVALAGVDLILRPGQIVGLIGPNGAGKTTFIDAVCGYVRPASGAISLDGRDMLAVPAHRRVAAGVARSWQSLELLDHINILENLLLASDSAGWRWWHGLMALAWPGRASLNSAALAAVNEFSLAEDLHRLPGDLSYSRRRLVAIARSVALNPSVLLLDEPAAGLSTHEAGELGRLIRRLAQSRGIAILLIEHDVEMVLAVCDEVVVLNFGRRIAAGSPAEIRADPAVVAAYLGTTSRATAGATAIAPEPAP